MRLARKYMILIALIPSAVAGTASARRKYQWHSFDITTKRIGFACKWAEINKKGEIVSAEGLNTGGTTHAWAKRNKRDVVEEKIMDVAKRNILNTHALVKKVATLEPELRMLRLTSDMLSFYTMDEYKDFWHSTDVQSSLQRWFEQNYIESYFPCTGKSIGFKAKGVGILAV